MDREKRGTRKGGGRRLMAQKGEFLDESAKIEENKKRRRLLRKSHQGRGKGRKAARGVALIWRFAKTQNEGEEEKQDAPWTDVDEPGRKGERRPKKARGGEETRPARRGCVLKEAVAQKTRKRPTLRLGTREGGALGGGEKRARINPCSRRGGLGRREGGWKKEENEREKRRINIRQGQTRKSMLQRAIPKASKGGEVRRPG